MPLAHPCHHDRVAAIASSTSSGFGGCSCEGNQLSVRSTDLVGRDRERRPVHVVLGDEPHAADDHGLRAGGRVQRRLLAVPTWRTQGSLRE